MLQRPRRPLPRQFNRRVRPSTRAFVEKRHDRRKKLAREWRARHWRRAQHAISERVEMFRRWFRWIAAGFFILLFLFLLFSPVFEVREIRIQRTQTRLDVGKVQEALAPLFRRRLFFLPAREITSLVRNAVPDVETVDVRKQYATRTVDVSITLKPFAWRAQIDQPGGAPSGSGSAVPETYLTADGFLEQATGGASDRALPILHITDWETRPVPGTQVLTEDVLQRLRATEAALQLQFGAHIHGRAVFLRAREYHIDIGTVTLWFDLKSSLEDELQRYRIFLQSVGPAEVKQYVDLRLAGRVVYR